MLHTVLKTLSLRQTLLEEVTAFIGKTKNKMWQHRQTLLVWGEGGIKVGSTEFLSLPEVLFIVKHRIQR